MLAGSMKMLRLNILSLTAIAMFQMIYGINSVFTLLRSLFQYVLAFHSMTLTKNKYPDITKNVGMATFTSVSLTMSFNIS